MGLNTLAGRSFNDLCQYPVFPWVREIETEPVVSGDSSLVTLVVAGAWVLLLLFFLCVCLVRGSVQSK